MEAKIYNGFVEDRDCQIMIERLEYLCNTGKVIKKEDGRIQIINLDDPVLQGFANKYYHKAIKLLKDDFKKYNGYVSTKYVQGVGMSTHLDSEPDGEMGVLMYLNSDYEGGEFIYTSPDGTEHSIKANRGDMIYCPSWYPHGVNKVISGTRYFFTVSLVKQNQND